MRLPAALVTVLLLASQAAPAPPATLPAAAVASLAAGLSAAARHAQHVWRDTTPFNGDGTLNAYIEIPRGDRRKWEFDIGSHRRAVDRVMPADPGGYPMNYGFVPQTISWDGDPFDVLVLGPPLRGGSTVRGIVVGLMQMEDEKGLDSKVVVSPISGGRPRYPLDSEARERIGTYFARYKDHQPGAFSKVPGWGTREDGVDYVRRTHAFFQKCRNHQDACTVRAP